MVIGLGIYSIVVGLGALLAGWKASSNMKKNGMKAYTFCVIAVLLLNAGAVLIVESLKSNQNVHQ